MISDIDYKIENAYRNSTLCCADDEWRRGEYKKYEQLVNLKKSEPKDKIYLVFGQNYEVKDSRTVIKAFSSHDKAHKFYKECSEYEKLRPNSKDEDAYLDWMGKNPAKDSMLDFFFIGEHEVN